MLLVGLVIAIALTWLASGSIALASPGVIYFVGLIGLVMAYNVLHGCAGAIILMGLCRSFIILGCSAVTLRDHVFMGLSDGGLWIAGPAGYLLLYTMAISIVARREVEPGGFGGPKVVMNMIAAMPLLDAVWLLAIGLWPTALFSVGCAVLTKRSHRRIAGS